MRSDLADFDLDALLRRAARLWPESPAMLADAGVWTWAALDADVDAWVADWRAAGVRAGDPVAMACEKRPEVVIAFLACARMGSIYVPVNHKLPLEQVQDALASLGVQESSSEIVKRISLKLNLRSKPPKPRWTL